MSLKIPSVEKRLVSTQCTYFYCPQITGLFLEFLSLDVSIPLQSQRAPNPNYRRVLMSALLQHTHQLPSTNLLNVGQVQGFRLTQQDANNQL
jgi:hypothetical protein